MWTVHKGMISGEQVELGHDVRKRCMIDLCAGTCALAEAGVKYCM